MAGAGMEQLLRAPAVDTRAKLIFIIQVIKSVSSGFFPIWTDATGGFVIRDRNTTWSDGTELVLYKRGAYIRQWSRK